MKYTLSDLIYQLAPFCDGGLCPTDTGGPLGSNRVVLRINEAVERLSVKPGIAPRLKRCVRMCAYNGCITCGRDVEKILKARIDGEFANVFDKWYEFIEGGPGILDDDSSNYIDLIDRDRSPVQYNMPAPMRVAVFSDQVESETAQILIRGFDESNREVRTETSDGWVVGEYLNITRDIMTFTSEDFSMISSVIKPVTNGNVYLSALYMDDYTAPTYMQREHLASYHPDDTRPSFRRYAFKSNAYSDSTDYSYRVNALVKMRVLPMTRNNDMCIIESMPAIKVMLQAMRYYDTGDVSKGQSYEAIAEKLLLENADDQETVQAIPEIQLEGFGMGDIDDV